MVKKDLGEIEFQTGIAIDGTPYLVIYVEDEDLFPILEKLEKAFRRNKKVRIDFYQVNRETEDGFETVQGYQIRLRGKKKS